MKIVETVVYGPKPGKDKDADKEEREDELVERLRSAAAELEQIADDYELDDEEANPEDDDFDEETEE